MKWIDFKQLKAEILNGEGHRDCSGACRSLSLEAYNYHVIGLLSDKRLLSHVRKVNVCIVQVQQEFTVIINII